MNPVQAALPFPNIDPVMFSIGPLAIHWYGLAYVAGILLGWRYTRAMASRDRLWHDNTPAMSATDMDDFLLWAAAGIVLPGRISLFFAAFGTLLALLEHGHGHQLVAGSLSTTQFRPGHHRHAQPWAEIGRT